MGAIKNALANKENTQKNVTTNQAQAGKSVNVLMSSLLDSENYRKRFNELLGARTPQFVSSLVSLVNADQKLIKAFTESPLTVIQSALKAATFDLPIDPNLGYAYIVPFNNKKDDNTYKMEATFIMGYKGMKQLALRTGAYKTLTVVDVREGELKHYDRLKEIIEIEFIEDEELRESLPIVGWCGYFCLMNGAEKTIYRTRKKIEAHEKKHRKGNYMGKGWKDDFNAMAEKTVYRELIGKHGLMSIDYQKADRATIAAAEAIATGVFDDEDSTPIPTQTQTIINDGDYEIDTETGEAVKIEGAE